MLSVLPVGRYRLVLTDVRLLVLRLPWGVGSERGGSPVSRDGFPYPLTVEDFRARFRRRR